MPLSIDIETNFRPWLKRKLKRACGETICFLMFLFALIVEPVKGAWDGLIVAYQDWQDLRWSLHYRPRRR